MYRYPSVSEGLLYQYRSVPEELLYRCPSVPAELLYPARVPRRTCCIAAQVSRGASVSSPECPGGATGVAARGMSFVSIVIWIAAALLVLPIFNFWRCCWSLKYSFRII